MVAIVAYEVTNWGLKWFFEKQQQQKRFPIKNCGFYNRIIIIECQKNARITAVLLSKNHARERGRLHYLVQLARSPNIRLLWFLNDGV